MTHSLKNIQLAAGEDATNITPEQEKTAVGHVVTDLLRSRILDGWEFTIQPALNGVKTGRTYTAAKKPDTNIEIDLTVA